MMFCHGRLQKVSTSVSEDNLYPRVSVKYDAQITPVGNCKVVGLVCNVGLLPITLGLIFLNKRVGTGPTGTHLGLTCALVCCCRQPKIKPILLKIYVVVRVRIVPTKSI